MRSITSLAAVAALASIASIATPAAAAPFLVTYEAAGETTSSAGFDYLGIETFDGKAGQTNFTSTFTHDGVTIFLEYNNVMIRNADKYGGANGTDYAVAGLGLTTSYTIDIITTGTDAKGVNYFGYWLSALDSENYVSFWNGDEMLFEFNQGNVEALLTGKPEYWGHPGPGEYEGDNDHEPYVFLNFFAPEGTVFDRVVFSQGPGNAGYESDNHTLGFYNRTSGTPVPPPVQEVPEPAALGLLGAGLIGIAALRRRRTAA